MNLKLFIIGILILLNMNIGQAAAATYCGGDIVVHEETDLSAVKDATYTKVNWIVVDFEDICLQLHVSGPGYVKSLGSYDYANFWVKVYKEGDLIYKDSETKWGTGYTGDFDYYTPIITKGNHTFIIRNVSGIFSKKLNRIMNINRAASGKQRRLAWN